MSPCNHDVEQQGLLATTIQSGPLARSISKKLQSQDATSDLDSTSCDESFSTESVDSSDCDMMISGNDPRDYDWVYHTFKFVVPIATAVVYFCTFWCPFHSYTSRLLWLWAVFLGQLVFIAVGYQQCSASSRGLKRVQEAVLKYSVVRKSKDSCEPTTQPPPPPVTMAHVIVIPNYNEPFGLLEATLTSLASHALASAYTIVLAMENHEKGHEGKAERLIQKFKESFHRMIFTSHVLQNGEQKFKSSNVAWATRHVSKDFANHPELYASATCTHGKDLEAANCCNHCCDDCIATFSSDKVMITVIDADAMVPSAYFMELEATVQKINREHEDLQNPGEEPPRGCVIRSLFAPPVIMSRNVLQVPRLTRMMDLAWSGVAFQSCNGPHGIGFPISNHSLTLRLDEDVHHADTHEETIADDTHVFLKCFFKTNGGVSVQPIPIPLNMLMLNTGDWWGTVKARYDQAFRHQLVVHEAAYALRQWVMKPGGQHGLLKLRVLWEVSIATMGMQIFPVFISVAAPVCQLVHLFTGWFSESPTLLFLLLWTQAFQVLALGVQATLYYNLDKATRACNTHIYELPNLSLKETILPFPLLGINMWVYMIIPGLVAVFRSVLPDWARCKNIAVAKKKL